MYVYEPRELSSRIGWTRLSISSPLHSSELVLALARERLLFTREEKISIHPSNLIVDITLH
jgi:hypothetical protein